MQKLFSFMHWVQNCIKLEKLQGNKIDRDLKNSSLIGYIISSGCRCILRWLVLSLTLGKPIKIQCNYTCSCKLTKIFCLEFKILAITYMSSQWEALQSKKKIILTRIQYRHNYLNERRRLLLSICDAIQCGKMGNKI